MQELSRESKRIAMLHGIECADRHARLARVLLSSVTKQLRPIDLQCTINALHKDQTSILNAEDLKDARTCWLAFCSGDRTPMPFFVCGGRREFENAGRLNGLQILKAQ